MKREKYHIISVRDSDDFIQTITEDLHAKNGILISVGKLKSNPTEALVTQEFLFDKKKWDLEDAQKWVAENGDVSDIMLDKPVKENSMKPITKIFDCEIKDFNEKERTFRAIASTEAVDRDGDILRAEGWKLGNYKKNPQGLWSHMSRMLPIFRTIEIGINGKNQLEFVPKFVPKEISPLAEQVFQLYKHKFLRAFSVRFLPYKWEEIAPKQDAKPGTRRTYGRDYKSQDLLEVSCCTVPANPECLANKDYQDMMVKSLMAEKWDELSAEEKLKLYIGENREGCKHCGKHECERAEYGCESELNNKNTDDYGEVESDNYEIGEKPFPNEHSLRLKDPATMSPIRVRRTKGSGKAKVQGVQIPTSISVIWFIIKSEGKEVPVAQALRFPIATWSEAEARAWIKKNKMKGTFEPAKKSESDSEGKEGLINISISDIDKVKPLLDILKSGRVISQKNKKLILEAISQLDKTSAALKGLLEMSEPERSIDDIINEVKTDLGNEEVSKEDVDRLVKLIETNQTVLNSLKGQEG